MDPDETIFRLLADGEIEEAIGSLTPF